MIAQGYQGIHGSPYAGSTGIRNNPAAAVSSAYKWDLTLFSAQAKISTNTLYLSGFSFGSQDSTALKVTQGYSSRFLHNNIDFSLLNFHYKLSERSAVAFNLRARSYNHVKTYPVNSADTIYSVHDFFAANNNTPFLDGFATHTAWLEADLNYSQVLAESNTSKLTGGITLQVMKGASGAFGKVNRVSYLATKNGTDTTYSLTNGGGSFGYSSNYDETTAGNAAVKNFLKNTFTRVGLSLGMEYLVYDTDDDSYAGNNNLNYTWKIGVALMDIGANAYKSSRYSSMVRAPNTNITDRTLDAKLSGVQSMREFHDSLATLFAVNQSIGEQFLISNPTRLVINIDRPLGHNLYVNGDLSLNFFAASSYQKLRTRELNLLTITPRWETLAWGVYLPVQYNTQGQVWVGAALKLGPLLIGLHNIKWLQKIEGLNGGGYLMLDLHPFNKKKVTGKLDCPK
ncbi:MAG: hypothetical protein NVS3B15_09630 [Sediminibacterium sp.]